jgi:hypothetical protein
MLSRVSKRERRVSIPAVKYINFPEQNSLMEFLLTNSNNLEEAELNETSWQDSSKRTKSSTESDGIAGVVMPTIMEDYN